MYIDGGWPLSSGPSTRIIFSRSAHMNIHLPEGVNLDSPQVKLILQTHQGHNEKNMDILSNCLHKDFQRVVHPQSLGAPKQNKEEYIRQCAELYVLAEVAVGPTPLYSTFL